MPPGERGIALLETLIALVILGVAGVSSVAILTQAADSLRRAVGDERVSDDEARLLTAVSLLSRQDLDQRLGRRTAGPYVVEIRHSSLALYDVRIGEANDPPTALLETSIYRPVPQ